VTVDVALFVTVTRSLLGLSPLEIASSPDYYIGTQFLGAQVQWERQQVSSSWLDGAVTVNRHRQMVTEQIAVEILDDDLNSVRSKMITLIQAFVQDNFRMTVVAGNSTRIYQCEAADYQDASWTTPRMAGAQGQILFSVPRQPVLIGGGVN
jgi:hypothetical protein